MTTTPLFPPGLTSGHLAPSAATPPPGIEWSDTARQAAFEAWLADQATQHGLLAATARPASADASFRRYFRVDRAQGGSCIVMDAPPDKENCQPFVTVAGLMAGVGLRVPDILAWDAPQGFMLLNDLGTQTLLDVLDLDNPQANQPRYGLVTGNAPSACCLLWRLSCSMLMLWQSVFVLIGKPIGNFGRPAGIEG